MTKDNIKVDSIGVLMRRADRLEDEAKALKSLAHREDARLEKLNVPEAARRRTGVAYRRVQTENGLRLELVTDGAESGDGD